MATLLPGKGDLARAICLLEEVPDVWAEKVSPSLVCNYVPIMVALKPRALPIRQRQYPMPQEACLEFRPTYSG
jgi:hypothetical protein